MDQPIRFTVPAVPVPQPRQRHRIVSAGTRQYVSNYTPAKHPVNAFKAAVQQAFSRAHDGPPIEGPLRVSMTCVFPRPKAKLWKSKPMPREPYTANRSDWDNVGKAVSDALNGLAWRDDGQLVDVRVQRWIASGDEQPHVEVVIQTIREL